MYIAARTATLNPSRNVEQITNEIIFIKQNAQRVMLATYIELGKRLTEAKGMLNHGEWLPWLSEKVQFSRQSAERFMLAYREYGELYEGTDSNCSILRNISISNALALLAVPEQERESFAQEVDAEHISTRELEEAIRERDEARRDAEDAQKRNALQEEQLQRLLNKLAEAEEWQEQSDKDDEDNRREIESLKEKIKELESRPIEVAVHQPNKEDIDKAVAEALKETNAKHKAEIKELKSNKAAEVQRADRLVNEKNELERKLAELRDKLSAAAQDDGERERLKGELEKLRRELSMSGAEMTEFKLRFAAWQEAYNAMMSALSAVPEDQRGKCEAAVKAVLEGWSR